MKDFIYHQGRNLNNKKYFSICHNMHIVIEILKKDKINHIFKTLILLSNSPKIEQRNVLKSEKNSFSII